MTLTGLLRSSPVVALVTLLALPPLPSAAADGPETEVHSKVLITPGSREQLHNLWEHGVYIDHYSGNAGSGIEVVLGEAELSRLAGSGIPYRVLAEDLNQEMKERRPPTMEEMAASQRLQETDNVDGFGFGSMGGFYTYDEVVAQLDSMVLLYPHLITAKSSIGMSHQGRDLWMVKISDNPGIDESAAEPAAYYDALHHAREPGSMSSTLYYMFWLLENYGIDPVATYLVDNRELFFVPVVNPDGYVYNQQTNPNGGGFWRKNRRVNGGNCFGVDLNRNYSFGFGNNNGSSPDPCSDTYRGPNAFSEPETQAIRDFLADVNPAIAFSTHTYAERFLNPYGYIAEAPDYEVYSEFASDFVAGSTYLYGITSEMLGYFSSGTTRDYLHSEGTYAWTPELGADGFWPPQSSIIPIASENLPRFRYLAWVAGAFADLQNLEAAGPVIPGAVFRFSAAVRNRGLRLDAGDVVVTASTTYPHATPLTDAINFGAIPARTVADGSATPFSFAIAGSAGFLEEVPFVITIQQDGVETARDTISFLVGARSVLFGDDAESGRSLWTVSGSGQQWDTTFVDSRGGSRSFADSRYGNSNNNTNNYLTAAAPVNLSGVTNPYLEFWAKWAIEKNFDYTRVQVSTNGGGSWVNLAGLHTSVFQGQPSYTGARHWVRERIDLTPYAGTSIQLRFHHDTDGGVPGDGFYFDDVEVVGYSDSSGSAIACGEITSFLARCNSNGAVQSRVLLQNSTIHAGESIEWLVDGQPYSTVIITNGTHSIARLSVGGLGAGTHTVELVSPGGCFDPVNVVCQSSFTAHDEEWHSVENLFAEDGTQPAATELSGGFPNPFNPSTALRYSLASPLHVTLKIYDLLGREVAVLVDRFQEAGDHSAVWDTARNRGISSGVYLARLEAGSVVQSTRLLLLK